MPEQSVSFASDIRPLFRRIDVDHMRPLNVFLDDYEYMSKKENAILVRDFISGDKQPQMPPDAPWPQDRIDLLSRWIDSGCAA